MSASTCKNCESPIEPAFEYCPYCSQKAATHRLTIHEIGHEVLHAATHADKGILFLLKELALRPGIVIKEYVDGKRKKYFNPFSFLLIVAGIYVFSNSLFHTFEQPVTVPKTVQVAPDSSHVTNQQRMAAKLTRRIMEARHFINAKTNVVIMIGAPFFGLISYLLYRKKKKNYAEHLVAMVFINSFLSLVTTFIFGPLIFFTAKYNMYFVWLSLMMIFHLVYIGMSYHGWLQYPKEFKYYAKCIINAALMIISWSILMTIGMFIYAIMA